MRAGSAAYSQAVKHHTMVLSDLKKEIDEMKLCIKNKDSIISEQGGTISQMAATVVELKEKMDEMTRKQGIILQTSFAGH